MTTDEPVGEPRVPEPEANGPSAAHDATAQHDTPDPTDLSITFTPRQILGGFALLAALVMLLRRRRRDPDRGEPD